MESSFKKSLLSIVIMLTLLGSTLNVMPVYADDETPPLPVTEEPIQPPVTGNQPSAINEEPQAEVPTSISEVLEQMPDDTTLIVLSENGEALPLISEAAADVLTAPDPQFCPAGLSAGDAGCSPSRTTIADALLDAYTVGGSGTIYVEPGTFSNDVLINGNLFTGGTPLNFALIGTGSNLTTLDGMLTIINMNSFTLSGFSIKDADLSGNSTFVLADTNSGVIQITDVNAVNSVTPYPAIFVLNHNGDISLSNVTTGSDNTGAFLNNTAGTGNITVEDSQFNNSYWGLYAVSNGNITITANQFNDIGYAGLTALSHGDVQVQCSRFENNTGYDINAQLFGGTLTLNGNIFANTTSGNINMSGGTLVDNPDYDCNPVPPASSTQSKDDNSGINESLPLNVIQVNGSEKNALDCTRFSGTELILPQGDRVILPCPNGDEAALTSVTSNGLPGALDDNFTFISGLTVSVTPALLSDLLVKFSVPADQQNANFTILHWDGNKWEDLGGTKVSSGFFGVHSADSGIFILVSK